MKPAIVAALACAFGLASARSIPPVAAVQSSMIPVEVMAGLTPGKSIECTFGTPQGTRSVLSINGRCWLGYVYIGDFFSVDARNPDTQVAASGADYVPAGECVPGTPPRCTIQLGVPVYPTTASSAK